MGANKKEYSVFARRLRCLATAPSSFTWEVTVWTSEGGAPRGSGALGNYVYLQATVYILPCQRPAGDAAGPAMT
jgi:hypothetical protein